MEQQQQIQCKKCKNKLKELGYVLQCKNIICGNCLIELKKPNEEKIVCPIKDCKQDIHVIDEKYNKVIEQIRQSKQVIYCKDHIEEQKQCEYLCQECKKLLCVNCIYEKHFSHQNHQKINLSYLNDEFNKIKESFDKIQNYLNEIYNYIETFQFNPSKFDSNSIMKQIQNFQEFISTFSYKILEELKINQPKIINFFNESNLVKSQQQDKWIFDQVKTISNYQKATLLLRGSRDGFTTQLFHQNCDNKGPTITFIKSTNGYTFGGFSPVSWQNSGNWQTNNQVFAFQLDKLTRHEYKQSYSLYFHNAEFMFGNNDIRIFDKCNEHQKNYSNFGNTFKPPDGIQYNTQQAKEYLAGSYNFQVEEMEVFQLT